MKHNAGIVAILLLIAGLASAQTTVLNNGGNVYQAASWTSGLPTATNPGLIDTDGSVTDTTFGFSGATVTQSSGTIDADAFNFTGGTWNLTGGRIEARFVLANQAGSHINASGGTIVLRDDVTSTQRIGVANGGSLTVSATAILDATKATVAISTDGTINILGDWTGSWTEGTYTANDWQDHFINGEITLDSQSLDATQFSAFFRVSPDGKILSSKLFSPGHVVNDLNDTNDGIGDGMISLREAIDASDPYTTITFDPALNGATITLTQGQLLIDRSLAIDASALPAGLTIDANGTVTNHRVLEIAAGGHTVTLDSLQLANGQASGASPLDFGGGIYNDGGTLTLNSSTLSGNSAFFGGGIVNFGTLILNSSTLSGNSADLDGGGIFSGGSILSDGGTLTINSSTLSSNSANFGGGIFNRSTLTLNSSTLSGNSADLGGGIYNDNGTLTLSSSTLSGNSAGDGGGIYNDSGTLSLLNSLIAQNTATSSGPDIRQRGLYGSNSGDNFIGDPTGAGTIPGTQGTDYLTGNAQLAPLGDYGGPTQTMPPLLGSPVIDAASGITATTDQRGFHRPLDGDNDGTATPDIGATEAPNWTDPGPDDYPSIWLTDLDGDGYPYGLELTLGTDPANPDPTHPANLSSPEFNAGEATLSFGRDTILPGVVLILKRSTTLQPGSFSEVYRFTGSDRTQTLQPDIDSTVTSDSFSITDENPPTPAAFYQVEALLSSE